jgi:peptidoglycan L-alanyl-D-glutamate endopeptidase CwlK
MHVDDIVLLYDKNGDGTFETASWEVNKYWIQVATYFKNNGWEWGGDWKTFKDAPHFQKSQLGWKELKTKIDIGNIIVDNGIKYPKL